MSRLPLGLAIAGAAVAFLSALVFTGTALLLPVLYVMVAGGILIASHGGWRTTAPAVGGILVAILAAIGAMNLTLGKSGLDASWFVDHAAGLTITACLAIAAAGLALHWEDLEEWLAYGAAGVLAVAAILGLVMGAAMDDHFAWPAIVVGFLSLVAITPSVQLLRQE